MNNNRHSYHSGNSGDFEVLCQDQDKQMYSSVYHSSPCAPPCFRLHPVTHPPGRLPPHPRCFLIPVVGAAQCPQPRSWSACCWGGGSDAQTPQE